MWLFPIDKIGGRMIYFCKVGNCGPQIKRFGKNTHYTIRLADCGETFFMTEGRSNYGRTDQG